jgi:hypothetical protein
MKNHPMLNIHIESTILTLNEYVQSCAEGLVKNGFMSVMEKKRFDKKFNAWIEKYKRIEKVCQKETKEDISR